MIPDNITKIHLEKAIDEIDKQGIRKGRHSSTYDLVHNGNFYPPKLVISIANRFANNIELDSESFIICLSPFLSLLIVLRVESYFSFKTICSEGDKAVS